MFIRLFFSLPKVRNWSPLGYTDVVGESDYNKIEAVYPTTLPTPLAAAVAAANTAATSAMSLQQQAQTQASNSTIHTTHTISVVPASSISHIYKQPAYINTLGLSVCIGGLGAEEPKYMNIVRRLGGWSRECLAGCGNIENENQVRKKIK